VQLARIHAPIGLPIGSKSPIEIAIATLAEVIAVRHGIRMRLRQDAT
jgi:xanthine dehydrogenase accessory factor